MWKALQAFVDDEEVVEHACTALQLLAASDACRNLVSTDSGCRLLTTLIERYSSHQRLLLVLLALLQQLALSEAGATCFEPVRPFHCRLRVGTRGRPHCWRRYVGGRRLSTSDGTRHLALNIRHSALGGVAVWPPTFDAPCHPARRTSRATPRPAPLRPPAPAQFERRCQLCARRRP